MTNAQELLDQLVLAGVKIKLAPAGKIQFDAPKGMFTTEYRKLLRSHKSALLELITQKTSNLFPLSTVKNALSPDCCPHCSCKLAADDCPELTIRFCQFCDFIFHSFADQDKVYILSKEMFDAATFDQCEAMSDALAERAAIFVTENNWSSGMALEAAEQDLIPRWLDEFRLRRKFKIQGALTQ